MIKLLNCWFATGAKLFLPFACTLIRLVFEAVRFRLDVNADPNKYMHAPEEHASLAAMDEPFAPVSLADQLEVAKHLGK